MNVLHKLVGKGGLGIQQLKRQLVLRVTVAIFAHFLAGRQHPDGQHHEHRDGQSPSASRIWVHVDAVTVGNGQGALPAWYGQWVVFLPAWYGQWVVFLPAWYLQWVVFLPAWYGQWVVFLPAWYGPWVVVLPAWYGQHHTEVVIFDGARTCPVYKIRLKLPHGS